jgi:hypothetical protein
MGNDYLALKWGTLKGWRFKDSPVALEAFKEYVSLGSSMSAMAQKDTPRQKELILIMIDNVNGPISNEWDDIVYETKEQAKEYILNYGKKSI